MTSRKGNPHVISAGIYSCARVCVQVCVMPLQTGEPPLETQKEKKSQMGRCHFHIVGGGNQRKRYIFPLILFFFFTPSSAYKIDKALQVPPLIPT